MRIFERKQNMNQKFIIIGTIVLAAGTIGMLGAGTVVWIVMSHRQNQIAYKQNPGEPAPEPVPIRSAASGARDATERPVNSTAAPHRDSAHPVMFNGQSMTQQELAALLEQDRDDDPEDQSLPAAAG